MTQNQKPLFPNPVLRVAFAGNRALPDDLSPCQTRLSHVYSTCITALKAVQSPHFRSTPRPILRFISGLAEGWDHEAARCLEQLQPIEGLTLEFAGVSGCALDSYRASRDPAFLPIFDAWVDKCSYILELDEVFPVPSNPAQEQRVYQAQSFALLRQADLLLAVDGFARTGLPGGTKDSVLLALQFGIPVLYLNTDTNHLHFLSPGDDFYRSLSESLAIGTLPDWETPLKAWLGRLLKPPGLTPHSHHGKHRPDILERFFREEIPEGWFGRFISLFSFGRWLPRFWPWFEGPFKKKSEGKSQTLAHLEAKGFDSYESQAEKLTGHYAGLYRGGFLSGYALALLAILFATASLWILGHGPQLAGHFLSHCWTSGEVPPLEIVHEASHAETWLLLALTLGKFLAVILIYRITKAAHKQAWNEQFTDFRYLAERLRAMRFLPWQGIFQFRQQVNQKYTSRVLRQSSIDWLFDAVLRAAPPADYAQRRTLSSTGREYHSIRFDNQTLLRQVRVNWIEDQADYHIRNASKLQGMFGFLEHLGVWLNKAAIGIVAIDLLLPIDHTFLHQLSESLHIQLHHGTPFLVAISIFLPAVVASMNGLRFQGELERLAERSAVMATLLAGRRDPITGQPQPDTDSRLAECQALEASPRIRNLDVIRFTEALTSDFTQEVSEWSVLYAKELVEP